MVEDYTDRWTAMIEEWQFSLVAIMTSIICNITRNWSKKNYAVKTVEFYSLNLESNLELHVCFERNLYVFFKEVSFFELSDTSAISCPMLKNWLLSTHGDTDLHEQAHMWPYSCPPELSELPSERWRMCLWHQRSGCPWVSPDLAQARHKQQVGAKTDQKQMV